MIASLPMYDSHGLRHWHDELWHDIRVHLRADGINAPDELTRSGDPQSDWNQPDLLLSQTCGLPFRAGLHQRLTLVAAPAIRVPDILYPTSDPVDLPAGQYYSVIVARADDKRAALVEFDGARLAYNDALSQSGWGLMYQAASSAGIAFSTGLCTGAHRASALAVVEGRADIAAIDVATWFGPLCEDRWRSQLKIVGRTPYSPALPYVSAYPDLVEPLFAALKSATSYPFEAKADLPAMQDALNIAPAGVVRPALKDYLSIPFPPTPPR